MMVSVNMICTSKFQAIIYLIISVCWSYACKQITTCGLEDVTFSCKHYTVMPFLLIVSHEVMKSPIKLCHTCMCQTPHFASFWLVLSYSCQHVSQLFLEWSFLLTHMVFALVSGAKKTWSELNPFINVHGRSNRANMWL